MKSASIDRGESDLVHALREGEAGAVERLVERHGPWVYRLALRLTGSPPDAEEVAQDALLKVAQKIGSFRGEAAFTSWVYRIAVNLAYEKLRRRPWREEASIDEVLPVFDEMGAHVKMITDWSEQVGDRVLAREARKHLEQAIALLPPEYKVVFVLHDLEERPNVRIAELLDLSLPAVKSRVHRARLFLRAKLADYFEHQV